MEISINKKTRIGLLGSGEVAFHIHQELRKIFQGKIHIFVADSNLEKNGINLGWCMVGSLENLKKRNIDLLVLAYKATPADYLCQKKKLTGFSNCQIVTPDEIMSVFPNARGWPLLARKEAIKLKSITNFVESNLSDSKSKSEYKSYCYWICDPRGRKPPTGNSEDQYFVDGIIKLNSREVFLDCGSYRGDTLNTFLNLSRNRFCEYYAFEPDFENFVCLTLFKQSLSPIIKKKIFLFNVAIGIQNCYQYFHFYKSQTSRRSTGNGILIQTLALSSFHFNTQPTFVKLDLEGSDFDAIKGMLPNLIKWRPKLCVAIYHNPNDFYQIPLFLMQALEDYSFYVRSHNRFGLDFVLYCIPK